MNRLGSMASFAFNLYRQHLAPHGVICVHVSNRFIDLPAVIAAAAGRLGWRVAFFEVEDREGYRYPNSWVILGPDPDVIEQLQRIGNGKMLEPPRRFAPWTDEHVNVLSILHL